MSIENMLALQDRMNSKVNPNWKEAGYQWLRAVIVEGAEALEHWGWKWWKKQTPDQAQFNIELVDIWHFILSQAILKWGDRTAAVLNSDACRLDTVSLIDWDVGLRDETIDARMRMEVLIGLCALRGNLSEIVSTFRVIQELDGKMSDADLYKGYLAKNVLNFFRQDHGYKEGTYIKTWMGEEDNVVLERICASLDELDEDTLYRALEDYYTVVLMRRQETAHASSASDSSFSLPA